MYEEWSFLQRLGHNIGIFGVGSKISLIERYLEDFQRESPKLIINGFSPIFTLDKAFNGIFDNMSDFLKVEFSPRKSTMEKIRILEKKLGDSKIFPYNYLFIVVHKIDVKAM